MFYRFFIHAKPLQSENEEKPPTPDVSSQFIQPDSNEFIQWNASPYRANILRRRKIQLNSINDDISLSNDSEVQSDQPVLYLASGGKSESKIAEKKTLNFPDVSEGKKLTVDNIRKIDVKCSKPSARRPTVFLRCAPKILTPELSEDDSEDFDDEGGDLKEAKKHNVEDDADIISYKKINATKIHEKFYEGELNEEPIDTEKIVVDDIDEEDFDADEEEVDEDEDDVDENDTDDDEEESNTVETGCLTQEYAYKRIYQSQTDLEIQFSLLNIEALASNRLPQRESSRVPNDSKKTLDKLYNFEEQNFTRVAPHMRRRDIICDTVDAWSTLQATSSSTFKPIIFGGTFDIDAPCRDKSVTAEETDNIAVKRVVKTFNIDAPF